MEREIDSLPDVKYRDWLGRDLTPEDHIPSPQLLLQDFLLFALGIGWRIALFFFGGMWCLAGSSYDCEIRDEGFTWCAPFGWCFRGVEYRVDRLCS